MNRETKLAIVAITLILAAAIIFFFSYRSTQPQFVQPDPNELEKRIQQIQNDPNMPPQAKAAAISELRRRMSAPQQPQPPATR
ncbi:MAG: hypothetical protein KatS3mg016_1063 [Fimbriimonadales bacterium]|nr:MAG: hypothetical protein KatS3mg016_1063 [Fimbriimonadales bacterium]